MSASEIEFVNKLKSLIPKGHDYCKKYRVDLAKILMDESSTNKEKLHEIKMRFLSELVDEHDADNITELKASQFQYDSKVFQFGTEVMEILNEMTLFLKEIKEILRGEITVQDGAGKIRALTDEEKIDKIILKII